MSAFSSGFTTGQISSIEAIARQIVANHSSQGTVTSITAGEGLCVASGATSITSSGTINLDAGLSTLIDVNYPTDLVNNNILTWTGTSWQNKSLTFSLDTPISINDLGDVTLDLNADNQLLKINENGQVIGVTDNHIETIIAGEGINRTVSANNKTVSLNFDADNIIISDDHTGNDYILIHNGTNTRRLPINQLKTSTLENDAVFAGEASLLVNNNMTKNVTGNNITLGVCETALVINFTSNGGITGELAIDKGGTGANTSQIARTNLDLEYNVDILSMSGPSFRRTMFGNNIIMMPKDYTFSLSSGASGTGYTQTNNASLTFTKIGGTDIFTHTATINIGSGGSISSPNSFTLEDQTSDSHFNNQQSYNLTLPNTSGTKAVYEVSPAPVYLSFGTCTSALADNIGIRSNNNILEVKNDSNEDWRRIFPMGLSVLSDVDNSLTPAANQILIYDGNSSKFKSAELIGNSNLDFDISYVGTSAQLTLNIADNAISVSKLDSTVTKAELNYLSGVTSPIQTQLNNKLGPVNNSASGDLLSYSGSTWGTFRNDGLSRAIIGVSNLATELDYRYLYDYTVGNNSAKSISESGLVFVKNGEPAHRVSLNNFTDNLVETNGGLSTTASDKKLKIDLEHLTVGTSIGDTDLLLMHNTTNNLPNSITKISFLNVLTNTDYTLRVLNGGLAIGVSVPLPMKVFDSAAILKTEHTTGVSGHLAAYQTTSNGVSLAFHNGTNWYNIELGAAL